MAFCQQCGQQLPENANVCPNCGTFVNAQAAPQQESPQQVVPQQVEATPDMDVQQNKGIAWLSYVGLFFLIPMFVKKESPYCQHHVKQGATLFATELAYTIATQILLAIIGAIFPGYTYYGLYFNYTVHSNVYNIFSVLFNLGSIFFLVMAIIGIVNAATGKVKELPLISKIPWIANLLDKFYKNA